MQVDHLLGLGSPRRRPRGQRLVGSRQGGLALDAFFDRVALRSLGTPTLAFGDGLSSVVGIPIEDGLSRPPDPTGALRNSPGDPFMTSARGPLCLPEQTQPNVHRRKGEGEVT